MKINLPNQMFLWSQALKRQSRFRLIPILIVILIVILFLKKQKTLKFLPIFRPIVSHGWYFVTF